MDAPELSAQLAQSLLLLAELKRIDRAFRNRDIAHVVLKGVPLAVRLTGRVDGRPRTIRDNDLLVRASDLERAVTTLEALGYHGPRNMPLSSQLRVNFEYRMHRRIPGGPLLVAEAHWAPFSPLLFSVDEDLVWSRTEDLDVSGLPVRVFDRALTLLHLAAHFAQHAATADWVLRDLATAWNRWGRELDRDDLLSLGRRLGLLDVLDFSLRAADALGLLQVSPPQIRSRKAGVLLRLLPPERLGPPQAIPGLGRTLAVNALAPIERLPAWLWTRLVPPVDAVAADAGRPLSVWSYLEYVRRPWRPLVRALRRRRWNRSVLSERPTPLGRPDGELERRERRRPKNDG